MRKEVKKQIVQLFETLLETNAEIEKLLDRGEKNKVRELVVNCQECALLIGNTIERFERNQEVIIELLQAYCEYLFQVYGDHDMPACDTPKQVKEELDRQVRLIQEKIIQNISVQLKVVFMPYKASMWTSLESIWREAQKDPECEVKVVVIPYYNLDQQQNKKELVYEASKFPQDVPIVNYEEYDVSVEKPDMIFIHNPYDDTNNVTRVPEQYYSYNLKKHTEQLIYSPYGLMGYYNPDHGAFMCCTNAVIVADKVLVQSEKVKQIYIDHGIERSKLIALGSPKVDSVVWGLDREWDYPVEWRERLYGRKVFLVNTHLSYFVKGYMYADQKEGRIDFAKWGHELIFDQLLDREGCAVIWRPHPLLKATLESRMLYDSLEFIEKLEQRIRESGNAVVDVNGEYDIAFGLSDALVTTYSSIIPEYMISGKPIYIYQHRLNEEKSRKSPISYANNYYRARRGEEPQFEKFIQMVLAEKDELYEERMKDVHRGFGNLEGTIGQEIYHKLKNDWKVD